MAFYVELHLSICVADKMKCVDSAKKLQDTASAV